MKHTKVIGIALGVTAVALVMFAVFSATSGIGGGTENAKRSNRTGKASKKVASAKNVDRSAWKRVKRLKSAGAEKSKTERLRPNFLKAAEDDRVKLSEAYRQLLDEIVAASENDDWKKLVKVVRRMQDSNEWPDGIPIVLHKAALDALKWFGANCAPEIVGFLGSSNQEVVQDAMDAIMDSLSDASISDYDRSELLQSYLKAVTDPDLIDSMLMELDNMRPTVRAETALKIYDSQNETAINLLKENLDFFFQSDNYEVTSREDIEKFLNDAKELYETDPEKAAEDEEFYGGDK